MREAGAIARGAERYSVGKPQVKASESGAKRRGREPGGRVEHKGGTGSSPGRGKEGPGGPIPKKSGLSPNYYHF